MNIAGENNARSFAFRVELLVKATSKDEAYVQLQQRLADAGLVEYRIENVPPAGKSSAKTAAPAATAAHAPAKAATPAAPAATAPAKAAPPVNPVAAKPSTEGAKNPSALPMEQRIRLYASANQLIRLVINKGRGVKLDIPCRIIQFDADHQLLTVYHVDEKMVYTFGFNEIDDLVVHV